MNAPKSTIRKCGICKQEGHNARNCRSVSQQPEPHQNELIASDPQNSIINRAPDENKTDIIVGESFDIPDNSNAAWCAWASQDYDHFQPYVELGDNAFAAILGAAADGKCISGEIRIVFDFDANVGSIEHSGGRTFPLNVAELARCFTYGGKSPTKLNEHGCGLKSSLAIIDPANEQWKIYIKYVSDGMLKVKRVSAPYSNKMTLYDETSWIGHNKNVENGSFITFPIDKSRFSSIYQKKDKALMADIHDRIKCEFTHMWMKVDEFIDGRIQMYYNNEKIMPFSFGAEGLQDYISKIKNTEFALTSSAKIKVQHVALSEAASSRKGLTGSYKFKRAMSSNGAYLFKNGRFIEHINIDEASRGNLYTSIFGSVPDNHHNGNIVIINMIGNQEQLPATVPTKNRFKGSALFDELIEALNRNIDKPMQKRDGKEACDVEKYVDKLKHTLKQYKPGATVETEIKFNHADGNTQFAPIDIVVTDGNERKIIECKRSIGPTKDDIGQLFINWMVAKNLPVNEAYTLKPVLLYRSTKETTNIVNAGVKCILDILAQTSDFHPTILNYDDVQLYPETS